MNTNDVFLACVLAILIAPIIFFIILSFYIYSPMLSFFLYLDLILALTICLELRGY